MDHTCQSSSYCSVWGEGWRVLVVVCICENKLNMFDILGIFSLHVSFRSLYTVCLHAHSKGCCVHVYSERQQWELFTSGMKLSPPCSLSCLRAARLTWKVTDHSSFFLCTLEIIWNTFSKVHWKKVVWYLLRIIFTQNLLTNFTNNYKEMTSNPLN